MTTRKYSSRSQQTTLSAALTAAGTSATVVSGTSLLGGATISSGQTFTVVIDPDTALEEIVDVTAVSTNTLTITRGVEQNGTGVAHSAGAVVRHMAIGRDYREANTHIEAASGVHGLSGSVVGTTDTQTLSGKTLTSPTLTTPALGTPASGILTNTTGLPLTTGITGTLPVANGGTGVTTSTGSGAVVLGTSPTIASPTITGTGAIAGTFTGNLTGNVTGNLTGTASAATLAATATALATGRTISLTGDVTGTSASFDGTGNASITAAIGANSIVDADINASAAIALSKLASDPLARANHTGTQLAATISDFDTQVRTSRLDQMAAPTGSVSLNSQKITNLATPTSNTDASTKAYVDTSIANLINGAPSTLDTLDEIAQALNDTANFSDTVVLKAGSTMTGPLTLSGAPSSNLHAATKAYVDSFAPSVAADAAAAAASAAAAAASYDSFDDRYLGAKASAPSVDNDGNALVAGALYWNTTTGAMQVWNATTSSWGGITSAVSSSRWSKTAVGGETTLNGADNNAVTLSYTVGYEQVYLNGVLLSRGGDYTASTGSSITGLTALSAGDIAEVLSWTPYSVANALTTTIVDAKGDLLAGTANDTVGRLAVGTNGQYLVADSAETTGIKWASLSAVSTLDLTINAQTGTTYTLVSGDTNKLVTLSNAGAITLTLPPSIFTAGQQIHIARMGAGAVALAQGAGVTIVSTGATASAPTLRAQYSTGTIICTASNTFLVIGDIA